MVVSLSLCLPDELGFFSHICLLPVPQPDVLCQCSAVLIKGTFPPRGAPSLCETAHCVVETLHAKLLCLPLQTQETLFLPRCITLIAAPCLAAAQAPFSLDSSKEKNRPVGRGCCLSCNYFKRLKRQEMKAGSPIGRWTIRPDCAPQGNNNHVFSPHKSSNADFISISNPVSVSSTALIRCRINCYILIDL